MKLSARNQFKGTVVAVKEGPVSAKVVVDIGGGNKITSTITIDSFAELGIKVGSEVTTIIKSSSVMLGIE
jgi:molybdopterin-binding protein